MNQSASHKIQVTIIAVVTLITMVTFVTLVFVMNQVSRSNFESEIERSLLILKSDETLATYTNTNTLTLDEYLNSKYVDGIDIIDRVVIYDENKQLITGDNNLQLDRLSEVIGSDFIEPYIDLSQEPFGVISMSEDDGFIAVMYHKDILKDAYIDNVSKMIIGFLLTTIINVLAIHFIFHKYIKTHKGCVSSELCMLSAENKSIIEQLDEAVISVDKDYSILTMNKAFRVMFDMNDEHLGKNIQEILPEINFETIIENNQHIMSKYKKIGSKKLLMNSFPLYKDKEIIGASAVFRSYLEVDNLLDQIKGYQEVSTALRNQKHEFQNKLHVVLGLIKIGDYGKAESYIMQNVYTTNLASDYYTSRLKDDRILALFVGKDIQAKEHNCSLLLTSDSYLSKGHHPINSDDIVLILGNLIDNSIDAYELYDFDEKRIVVDLFEDENQLKINVVDQAGGINESVIDHMFERGVSSKGENRGTGLSLVNEIVAVYNGKKHVTSSNGETEIEIILEKVKL